MPKVIPRQQTEAQALFFPESMTIPAGQWLVVFPDDTYTVMSEARMRQHYDMKHARDAEALQRLPENPDALDAQSRDGATDVDGRANNGRRKQ